MREILFRGKRKADGEWVEGDLFHNDNVRFPITCIGRLVLSKGKYTDVLYIDGQEIYEVIPETVGQYTGLTDKNGNKIFEGDIVDILTENEEIGVVAYDDGGFLVNADGFCVDFINNINGTDVEVIGNIHDNPELLEVGE